MSKKAGGSLEKINLLHARAKRVIPGGNSLLSKRREMFAPDKWPAFFDSARGIAVTDITGRTYRDFSHFGVGTNTLGYGNEAVDSAVLECVKKGNMSTLNPPEEIYLAERLVSLHPWSDMARFARSGGEANAISIRIARAHTRRSKVLFCGYHGWHDWYLSANLEDPENLNKQLLAGLSASGVPKELATTSIPFLYGDLEALEKHLAGGDVAAIKMEVMRSTQPSIEYLQNVRRLADKYQSVLIFDECTSGFRETYGGLHLKYGVAPDLTVLGKTLGNGYAITAVLGTRPIMQSAQSTFISSTFFTERIGYVAALAALEEMKRTRSWETISRIGSTFKAKLDEVFGGCGLPVEVGGMDALVSYNVATQEKLAIKTYITQEMLIRGFLATNLFYPSIAHSMSDMDDFFVNLQEVLKSIVTIYSAGKAVKDYLDGAVCHSTFERLN